LTLAVSAWLKLALDISWAWIALSVTMAIYEPPGSYWVIINRVMQVGYPFRTLPSLNFTAFPQALFTAGIILFAEKLFLRFVAINFHQRALADRLAENRLGLKALDHLSNAQPAPVKKSPYGRKGHIHLSSFAAFQGKGHRQDETDGTAMGQASTSADEKDEPVHEKNEPEAPHRSRKKRHASRVESNRRRKKFMATIVIDQLTGAIGQVALKNSKLNRGGDIHGLDSARKLAKKLFGALSVTSPGRSHLVVEGKRS